MILNLFPPQYDVVSSFSNNQTPTQPYQPNQSWRMEAYHHVLPQSRLGTGHHSLASYVDAVNNDDSQQQQHHNDVPIEFSLIVVLSRNAHLHDNNNASDSIDDDDDDDVESVNSNISILLGKKLRGIGQEASWFW